jgi:hypothetical protein
MGEHHGAATIKEWMEDLVRLARTDASFETSAGAEPGRDYAYLEYRTTASEHSILVFRVEIVDGKPQVKTYRIDGDPVEVREKVAELTHGG